MKKILSILFILGMTFTLFACKEEEEKTDPNIAIIDQAVSELTIGYTEPTDSMQNVTQNLVLASEIGDVEITWASDEPMIISNLGAVTRQSTNATVELTATLTLGDLTRTKKFTVIVIAVEVILPTFYSYTIQLPSTHLLEVATNIQKVEDAPDLLITGLVLDTYHFFHYETMSGYEYIKVFNNTNEPYNLKNHRITLANPLQGQNYENLDARVGNEVLSTGYLFNSLIDDDTFIPALSTALIWLKPYYWTVGSGTGAFNKPFSATVIHKDTDEQKGAFSQTVDDFEAFWHLEDSNVPVIVSTNMGIAGYRSEGGTEEMFPIFTPGGGTPYTHLNSTLLRSLEISKFNDQGGTATITLLNKYETLPFEKQIDPDPVYGKKAFNVMEIRENGAVVDGYLHTNTWKFFDPIVRVNFLGLVNVPGMVVGQTHVDFTATGNTGTMGWPLNVELQFRPPRVGERIMQLQLPLRELTKYTQYLIPLQLEVMRFSSESVTTYRFVDAVITLTTDPALGLEYVNFRTDEVESIDRMRAAAPGSLFTINLTRP